jgi:hypothetical protein
MSTNQLHGKTYEDYVKSAFQGSADHARLPSSSWDIEKKFDKIKSLPTSIKTTKSGIVDLADARKFWLINEPYRLLIAKYRQSSDIKIFHTLYEFEISKEEHFALLGNISYSEVEEFHNALLSYKKGFHKEARVFAKQKKAELKSESIVQLNQKIGHDIQRRLQCSVKIDELRSNVKEQHIYASTDFYRGISVSFSIQSSEREFNK